MYSNTHPGHNEDANVITIQCTCTCTCIHVHIHYYKGKYSVSTLINRVGPGMSDMHTYNVGEGCSLWKKAETCSNLSTIDVHVYTYSIRTLYMYTCTCM